MLAYTKISCDCRNPQRLLNKLTEKNIAVRKVEINVFDFGIKALIEFELRISAI